MDELSGHIQKLVSDSLVNYTNNELERAMAKTEKAYSLLLNSTNRDTLAVQKFEYNLALLYAMRPNDKNVISAKAYLDKIVHSSIVYQKKHEIATLYLVLGNYFLDEKNDLKQALECFKLAAHYFSKSQDWLNYCQTQLTRARLLGKCNMLYECCVIADDIQRACFREFRNPEHIVKIYCNLSTLYAKDTQNKTSVQHAKRLLTKALQISNEHNLSPLKVHIYLNLSAVCNMLGQYTDSVNYVENALESTKDPKSDALMYSDLKYNEGFARAKLKSYNEAMNCFCESHSSALYFKSKSFFSKNIWESLEALGTLACLNRDYAVANRYFIQAIDYFKAYSEHHKNRDKEKIEYRLGQKNKAAKSRMDKSKENVSPRSSAEEASPRKQRRPSKENDEQPALGFEMTKEATALSPLDNVRKAEEKSKPVVAEKAKPSQQPIGILKKQPSISSRSDSAASFVSTRSGGNQTLNFSTTATSTITPTLKKELSFDDGKPTDKRTASAVPRTMDIDEEDEEEKPAALPQNNNNNGQRKQPMHQVPSSTESDSDENISVGSSSYDEQQRTTRQEYVKVIGNYERAMEEKSPQPSTTSSVVKVPLNRPQQQGNVNELSKEIDKIERVDESDKNAGEFKLYRSFNKGSLVDHPESPAAPPSVVKSLINSTGEQRLYKSFNRGTLIGHPEVVAAPAAVEVPPPRKPAEIEKKPINESSPRQLQQQVEKDLPRQKLEDEKPVVKRSDQKQYKTFNNGTLVGHPETGDKKSENSTICIII